MANEIKIAYESGLTLYAIIRNSSGQVWYPTGQAFEDWGGGAGRDMSDYAISLTDKSGSFYIGDFDSNIGAGRYILQAFVQAGDTPSDDDNCIGSAEITWNGSSEEYIIDNNGRVDVGAWIGSDVTKDANNLPNVNAKAISASTAAADNVEANIGNLDEPNSLLLAGIYNIGIAAASAAEVATGRLITNGTESGSYTNTYSLDETYHVITASGGEIDYYYEFGLGDDAVPVELHIKGRLHEGSVPGGNDSVGLYVYNWNTSTWERMIPPLGDFTGVANSDSTDDEVRLVTLFSRHKDSSTGKVRVRFYGTSLETNTALYIDQIYLTYTAVLSYNGVANSILANADNKLQTDSNGYALADAVKISGSSNAADDVEANIGNLDAAVSSRSSHSAADVWTVTTRTLTSFGTLVSDIWDHLLTAITTAGSIGKLIKDNLDAKISSRSSHDDPDPNGYIDAAISSRSSHSASDVWSVTERTLTSAANITSDGNTIDQNKIANLDAAVSSRSSHSAEDVWSVTSRSLTDKSGFSLASDQSSVTIGSVNALGTQAKADVNAEVDNALNTAIPSSPTAGSINERIKTLDDNYTASRAGKLDNLDATVSSRSSHTAEDVWSVTSRTLTSFGNLVQDIWQYSARTLTSFGALAQDVWNYLTSSITTDGSIGKLLKDNIDATISSRAAESGGNIEDIKTKTDQLNFVEGDVKATLDGEEVSLSSATETQIDNIDTRTSRVDGLIENVNGDRFTAKALEQAPTGAGASQQMIRDAMLLAPSEGTEPAEGSIDKHLDDIEASGTGAPRIE